MDERNCLHCARFIKPTKNKSQKYCGKKECQGARKAKWHKRKLKEDESYKEDRKMSQRKWLASNSGYYKEYRRKTPEKTELNRVQQKIRDFRKRVKPIETKGSSDENLAKMDALNRKISKYNGMLVGLAKMDFLAGSGKNMLPLKHVSLFIKEKYEKENFEERKS